MVQRYFADEPSDTWQAWIAAYRTLVATAQEIYEARYHQ
jgi:hypothetical protein